MTITERLMPFTLCFMGVLVISACASLTHNSDILALVDGTPVTKGDLEYSLNVAHRRRDLSSARTLNIDDFVQKLIDDRLIIEEARRMGLEDDPAIQGKVDAYILRESVVRLYHDEIKQKISVTEEEIVDYYKVHHEIFHLGVISTGSEETALKIKALIRRGEDFENITEGSSQVNRREVTWIQMKPFMREAVKGMTPGEISDITKNANKFHVIKLYSRDEAPDDGLEGQRKNIVNAISARKDKERSNVYLEELRRDARIRINEDLLASLDLKDRKSLEGDKRMIVESDSLSLTVGEFVAMLRPGQEARRQKILKSWIDVKLVDEEALRRKYDETELREAVNRYRNHLLMDAFFRKALVPEIRVTEEELKDYYNEHNDDYLLPYGYKIQQITVKTEDEAEDILRSLRGGATFSWLAKTKSIDAYAPGGGSAGWFAKSKLSDEVADIIDTLKPGDISPIINVRDAFRIIRLQEKSSKKVMSFNNVRASVHKLVFGEKFRELREKYLNELRAKAEIRVYDHNIKSVAALFNQ